MATQPDTYDSSGYSSGPRKKKPITYGRAARNNTFSAQSVRTFFHDGKDDSHAAPLRARSPTKLKTLSKLTAQRKPLSRRETNITASDDDHDMTLARRTTTTDEFDVPLSDDEPAARPVPATAKSHGALPFKTKQRNAIHTAAKSKKEQKRKSSADTPAQKRTRTSSPASPRVPASVYGTDGFASVDSRAKTSREASPELDLVPTPSHRPSNGEQANARRSRRPGAQAALGRPGLSAPARLSEMVSGEWADEDSPDSSILDMTPPPALRRVASATPKQSQLWSQLLSSDPAETGLDDSQDQTLPRSRAAPTPYRNRSNYSEAKYQTPYTANGTFQQPSSRLVDRLKQAEGFDEDEIDDDDDDNEISGEEVEDEDTTIMESPRNASTKTVQDVGSSGSQVQLSESQSSVSQNTGGTKMTYARTRSYLQEDTLEDSLLSSLSLPPLPSARPPAMTPRGPLRAKGKTQSMFNIDSDSDDGSKTGIRSIHELRAAGNKKRFLDDNAVLFDDIKDHRPTSRSRRRGALIDLATKLCNKSFLARFVEHGFDRELTAEFSVSYPDVISDFAMCAVLVQLSAAEAAEKAVMRLHKSGALDVTARCLDEDRAIVQIAKDRHNNMSKASQSSLVDFSEAIRASDIWSENEPEVLTPQLLALKTMELMTLCLRRHGDKGSLLSTDVVSKLVGLATDVDNTDDTASSKSANAITRKLALSVLEFASASGALSDMWPIDLWKDIVAALPKMLQSQDQCQSLVLKLCINLTNNNGRNCDLCSQKDVLQAIIHQIVDGFQHLHENKDEQEHAARLDALILSLGLMINLAEFSDDVCEQTVALQDNGLASMVGIFVRGQEKVEQAQSEEETQSNVAYGFLAVLLGNLCQNAAARDEVRACLPGRKLQPLLAAIDEFAQYNRKVDSQTFENDEGRDVWEQFTGRLMTVVSRLQQFEA